MGPGDLAQVLRQLPQVVDSRVLVGTDTSDDAAVYLLDQNLAIVATTDFFSPMVDDAYTFGQIAASNSMSDVYAMGGEPLFALNLLAYPSKLLPEQDLLRLLQGGAAKAAEGGIAIIGGHTVENPELKYGLVVIGRVAPGQVWTNDSARENDLLVLTKPLGSGIISTAIRNNVCPEEVATEATKVMLSLNKEAAAVARKVGGINACTDVTGFGLLGHSYEMAVGSGVALELKAGQVPVIKGTLELVKQGQVSGGTRRNLEYLAGKVSWGDGVGDEEKMVLADAQTSGGLLFSVSSESASLLVESLAKAGLGAAVIGRVVEGSPGMVGVSK